MICFTVIIVTLVSMMISVTKPVQNIVLTKHVTDMADVRAMLGMGAIHVKHALQTVTTLVVMNC